MQDIRIVYPQELPQDFDFLQSQKNSKWGLIAALQTVLGPIGTWASTPTVLVSNVECVPTAPASMSVLLRPIAVTGPGIILALGNVDATALGGLSGVGGLLADTHNVIMTGILRDPVTLATPAPTTVGNSINYLVEAQYAQSDAGNTLANLAGQTGVVLQYYNPNSTTVALSGPQGAGTAQNNDRLQRFIVQVKAGTSAPTGTQLTPAPDAGFTGLFVVTVANGQTTVVAGNISPVSGGVPSIAGLLASHHGGVAGQAPKVNLATEVQGLLPNTSIVGPIGSQNSGLLIPSIYSGAGAPSATTLTAGNYVVRDLYWDTTNNLLYVCRTAGSASTSIWSGAGTTLVLGRQVTQNIISNTAVETDLITAVSIAANSLGTNRFLKFEVAYKITNNTGAVQTVTIRVKYGTQLISVDTPGPTSGGDTAYIMFGMLTAANATNAQRGWAQRMGAAAVGGIGTAMVATNAVANVLDTALTVDSTVAQNFQVTAQPGVASVSLTVTLESVLLTLY